MNKQDKTLLIKLARNAIKSKFHGNSKDNKIKLNNKFNEKRGVFITLTKNRKLRGCVGFPHPILPLKEAVLKAAKSAAFCDPRFPPLEESEIKDVKIEISILSLPKLIKNIDGIKISKHGLIIEYLGYSGLLLPQVAIEHNMNKLEFLEAVSEKAGLTGDAWQKKQAKLYIFEADIFLEQ